MGKVSDLFAHFNNPVVQKIVTDRVRVHIRRARLAYTIIAPTMFVITLINLVLSLRFNSVGRVEVSGALFPEIIIVLTAPLLFATLIATPLFTALIVGAEVHHESFQLVLLSGLSQKRLLLGFIIASLISLWVWWGAWLSIMPSFVVAAFHSYFASFEFGLGVFSEPDGWMSMMSYLRQILGILAAYTISAFFGLCTGLLVGLYNGFRYSNRILAAAFAVGVMLIAIVAYAVLFVATIAALSVVDRILPSGQALLLLYWPTLVVIVFLRLWGQVRKVTRQAQV